MRTVELRTSPHIRNAPSVADIMRNVVYALLPICMFAVYQFGISALALIIVVTGSCVLTEQFFCWMADKSSTVGDYSAVITGLLLALTLPPGFPLWMGAIAGFIGIGLGKTLFGGIGYNVLNPALIGRAFVQAAFPATITTWTPAFATGRFIEFIPSTLTLPFIKPPSTEAWSAQMVDGFTGATPLALQKFEGITTDTTSLFTGMITSGSIGETSALLIIVCGLYLVARKMMEWRIPVAMLSGAFVTGGILFMLDASKYPDPIFILFSGGLMLGEIGRAHV